MPWKTAWQYCCLENPHGQRSLAGYSPWGGKESDLTEVTEHTYTQAYCTAASTLGYTQQLGPGGLAADSRGHLPCAQLHCQRVCVCWGWSVQRSRGGWVCLTLTSQEPGASGEEEGAREQWWNVSPALWT